MAVVAHSTRSHTRRHSPSSLFNQSHGFSADAPAMKSIDVGDDSDSDDEPPPAIKFSKATLALLDNAAVTTSPSNNEHANNGSHFRRSVSAGNAGMDTPSRAPGIKIIRRNSPSSGGNTSPRIVHLNPKGPDSAQRATSVSGPYSHRFTAKREPTPEVNAKPEMITPAPGPRSARIMGSRPSAGSNASQDDPSNHLGSVSRPGSRSGVRGLPESSDTKSYAQDLNRSTSLQYAPENLSRLGSTTTRTRNTSADAAQPPGSQRVKRAPIGTGSFLKSGPLRRGFRRRDSDDNASPIEDPQTGSASQPSTTGYTRERSMSRGDGGRSRSGSVVTRATSVDPVSVHDFARSGSVPYCSRPSSRQGNTFGIRSYASGESRPPSRQASPERVRSRQSSVERFQPRRQMSGNISDAAVASTKPESGKRPSFESIQPKPVLEQRVPQPNSSFNRPAYRHVASSTARDASDDQENVPPPTFKRNVDHEFKYLGKTSMRGALDDDKLKASIVAETPVPVPRQEQRQALGMISGNTPHRPAPAPPPKMTALETGAASTTKTRKKRQHIVVNGKIFTQMGRIGKGGSSDVYCVMAENYKTFALKRVKLEDCDDNAVRGFKGEIDLLKKLTDVDRVVRLLDWELNEDKQELIVLMEKGDTDLNRILTLQLNGVNARFDSTFTRYHWKEMLECVQAVHEHDIVHSDLKPANFLLVQGRLKLIDFGIANAIDTDHTVNVHRDTHVGTPNYMSPESITDTNASQTGKDSAGRPLKKDMRIGKSSDVWSLGCILYQMSYGRPPFAHISNQISRILAITNPKHTIEFPETGVGGAFIPPTLRGLLRRCLNRDPNLRPTIREMLSASDAFLNPDGGQNGAVAISEELLAQIINKVVERCRDPKRGLPTPEEVGQYPRSFMGKIREMQEGL